MGGKAIITVVRQRGQSGAISMKYSTKDGTAKSPSDYAHVEGTLEFKHGESSKEIEVEVVNDAQYEKDEHFRIEIFEIEGGATFDATTDGMEDRCICKINIISDDDMKGMVDRLAGMINFDRHGAQLGAASYGQQIKEALSVNGGEEDEEGGKPGAGAWAGHILTLPFKLVFATTPPASMCGGWLCFTIALIYIGIVVVFIGDFAALMGCNMGLKDAITAITFVALGTSLPDAFASKAAAVGDPYADAAIGNVTGSNSVNVFLGLGLPWLLAAAFWSSCPGLGAPVTPEKIAAGDYGSCQDHVTTWYGKYIVAELLPADHPLGFVVIAGDLGFSVIIFTVCAITCLVTLMLRRKMYGAELGGPKGPKNLTAVFFVLLWFTYVICSAGKTLKWF